MAASVGCVLFFLLVASSSLKNVSGKGKINRIESDVDESSCICGFNKEILDKLESIVQASSLSCSVLPSATQSQTPDSAPHPASIQSRDPDQESGSSSSNTNNYQLSESSSSSPHHNSNSISSTIQVEHESKPNESPLPSSNGSNESKTTEQTTIELISKLTSEIHRLESQLHLIKPTSSSTLSSITMSSNQQSSSTTTGNSAQSGGPQVVDTAFLNGLPPSIVNPSNEVLSKLNQSQKVDLQEMESALQLTIPNVVSNIFSNIQNLTIQTEQNQHQHQQQQQQAESSQLTSIDGSKVDVTGDSSTQIVAEGEKLFLLWIEHRLESLHLTVSMANYIRKSAVNLFSRILTLYVQRMEKLGGSLEDNVRRATQMALSNTQSLISFLLKNYVNFAGGLMRIIGEQVSRVGKQLDTTGDTIAHINLNPFDIVSSVMESLPNPSDYSHYFRLFGKQLIGKPEGQQTEANNKREQITVSSSESDNENKPQSLMGTLSKTLSSWIG